MVKIVLRGGRRTDTSHVEIVYMYKHFYQCPRVWISAVQSESYNFVIVDRAEKSLTPSTDAEN